MKKRTNVLGCIAALAIFAALLYGGVAALGFLWWGRGFAGALAGRHAPEHVRAASRAHVYDHVIVVERDRVVFRRSLWASARIAVLLGLAAAIATAILLRRKRVFIAVAAIVTFAATFAISRARARDVIVPRGSPRAIQIRGFDVGGGRSGTRHVTPWQTGYDVVLVDGTASTILVRLPWNEEADARVWRDLIAEKIAAGSVQLPTMSIAD